MIFDLLEIGGEVLTADEVVVELVELAAHTVGVDFGSQGPAGPIGLTGERGPPGLSGASFEFVQSIALAEWVITHNLNRYPSVTVVDSAGDTVDGEVRYDSSNQLTLMYSAPFGGKAYLN